MNGIPVLNLKPNLTEMEKEKIKKSQKAFFDKRNERLKADLVDALALPSTRRVFAAIFDELKLMRDVSDPNGNEQSQNIGKRSAALFIYRIIVDFTGFKTMEKIWEESMEADAKNQALYKQEIGDDLYRKLTEMQDS